MNLTVKPPRPANPSKKRALAIFLENVLKDPKNFRKGFENLSSEQRKSLMDLKYYNSIIIRRFNKGHKPKSDYPLRRITSGCGSPVHCLVMLNTISNLL